MKPLLLGHRGARGVRTITENTVAAFDLALADGCDGFEFDVRLSADREAVVCHDPKFEDIAIARTRAEDLPQLPRLQSVLERYQERAFLDIELKVAGAEATTAKLVRQFPARRGFAVSSFLPRVLRTLHSENTDLPLGLICESTDQLSHWPSLPVQYVIPRHDLVEPGLLRELKDAGKKVLIWTVNDATEMRHLAGLGVDGIISDHPKLLAEALAQ